MPKQLYATAPIRDDSEVRAYLLKNLSKSKVGWIYVLQMKMNGSPIKIGWAKNPIARRTTLQTGNPVELEIVCVVPGAVSGEQEIHRSIADHRMLGEWFTGEEAWKVVRQLRDHAKSSAEQLMRGKPMAEYQGRTITREESERGKSPEYLAQLADMTPRMDTEEAQRLRRSGASAKTLASVEGQIHAPNRYTDGGKGRQSVQQELEELRVDGNLPLYIRRKAA